MKIAVMNESTRISGLGRYASDLATALNCDLFSLNLESSISPLNYPGKVFTSKPMLSFGSGWYLNHRFPSIFMRVIKKQIENQITKETVVHYASQGIPKLNFPNRYIYTVHDLFGLDSRYNRDILAKNFFKRNLKHLLSAKKIITVSNHISTQLEKIDFAGKIETIYPAISRSFKKVDDKVRIRKSLDLPEDKKLVLSVSTQDLRKNLKVIPETMRLLGNEYSLVRVGEPIGQCYSFKNIDDEKLNQIYNACDVLLFPSLEEGFGYPIAEAMATGLPVVASDIQVFHEIAEDAGILVQPMPNELASGVREAIKNGDDLTYRGLEVSKKYSFERFKERILTVYNQM